MSAKISDDDIIRWFDEFSRWGQWGDDDALGALNLITPQKRRDAAALVREGVTTSLSRVVEFAPRPDSGEALVPPLHFMQASGERADEHGSGAAFDWVGLPLHGYYVTHLDAHSHIFWKAKMYNGRESSAVRTSSGATAGGVDVARDGIFSRGVLLDIPAVNGGGELADDGVVTQAQLTAAEDAAGLRVGPGDVLLVRTGYGRTRRQRARTETSQKQPGLGPDCIPWIHERSPAVLATDTATDPAGVPQGRVMTPVHSVCMVAMGMWVVDGCDLEQLSKMCAERNQWEFLFTAAPLRLKNSTGSPLNPVAVF